MTTANNDAWFTMLRADVNACRSAMQRRRSGMGTIPIRKQSLGNTRCSRPTRRWGSHWTPRACSSEEGDRPGRTSRTTLRVTCSIGLRALNLPRRRMSVQTTRDPSRCCLAEVLPWKTTCGQLSSNVCTTLGQLFLGTEKKQWSNKLRTTAVSLP